MSAYTAAEIRARLVQINAAIDACLLGQSYTMDTGQGKQTVTRADLTALEKMRERWEAMLDEAEAGANPMISFDRYGSES